MGALLYDIRFAFRVLGRQKLLTLTAALTLALGIGMNTAIFSAVSGLLWNTLPYPASERLVSVWGENRKQGILNATVSLRDAEDWRAAHTLSGLAEYRYVSVSLRSSGGPQSVQALEAGAGFFDVLGESAALGRTFDPNESGPGEHRVAVITEGLWRRELGGDPGVIGHELTIDGRQHTVIGLMPPGFSFMYSRAEVFLPLRLSEEQRTRRDNRTLRVVARLAPGVSLSEADAELQALSKSIADLQPEAERDWRTRLRPLEMEVMDRGARLSIQTMFWAVLGVLLIACANIANLLLARGTLRQRELAIRVSLGAGKGRIIRLLLAESTVLAFLGGALGVLFAGWAIPVIRNLAPKDFPRLECVHLDSAALGYTFLLCLASSLVAGLVPAWLLSRNPLSHTLHQGDPRGTASRQRLLQGLVAAEVALAMTLLTLTGLLVRSFTHQLYADPGFDKQGLVTATVTLPQPVYPEGRQQAEFFRATLETLRRDARIEQASAVQTVPLGGSYMFTPLAIEGRTEEGEQPAVAGYTAVLPGFFQTFRIRLVGGRDFDDRDVAETTRVAIVNETMARQYWPRDPSPVGRRFRLLPAQNTEWMSIVGVARDIRTQSPMRPPRREFYLPLAQAPSRRMAIVARTTGDAARAAGPIREAVWSVDRNQPLGVIETIDDVIDRRAAGPRVTAQVIGFLGALALLLAGLGIYGVLSYLTAQRSREIGIRVALGAVRADVVGLVLRRGLLLAGAGLAAGTACAAALTPLIRSLLEGVEPHDPASFTLSAAALLSAAVLACAFPVLRALRLDPVTILRQE